MNHCISILECVTPELVQIARDRLPREYIDTLREKPHFQESLVARYLLSIDLGYIPEFDETGKPLFRTGEFRSLSHKTGFVYIGYGQDGKRVGVDIEICIPREKAVMDMHTVEEYALFGEKNWEHFYLLWTLKESVVKCFGGGLDNFPDVHIATISGKYTMYLQKNADGNEELTQYFPEGIVPEKEAEFFKYKRHIGGTFGKDAWMCEVSFEKNGLVYVQTHEI